MVFRNPLLLFCVFLFASVNASAEQRTIIKKKIITEQVIYVDEHGNEIPAEEVNKLNQTSPAPARQAESPAPRKSTRSKRSEPKNENQFGVSYTYLQISDKSDQFQNIGSEEDNAVSSLSIGMNSKRNFIAFEYINFPVMNHDYQYRAPLGQKGTDTRALEMTGVGFLGQSRWFSWSWLDIYSGVNLSIFKIEDKSTSTVISEKMEDKQAFFITPVMGLQTTPRKAISLFVEGRYLYQLGEDIEREIVDSIDVFGNKQTSTEVLDFNMLLVGVGVRWNF